MIARKAWFVWHSWAGLTCGLLLFVVCWSGTVATVSHEIDWLLNPELRTGQVDEIPWQAAAEAVRLTYPNWRVVEINRPRYAGFAMEVLVKPEAGNTHRVYVDPKSLEVTVATSYFNVQRFFRSFHMGLFSPNVPVFGIPIGFFIVGILSFPLLFAMVSSLVFFRRWWRAFFKLDRQKNARVFWSDVHKFTGVWSLWFVALIGITGLWYLVEWWVPYPPDAQAPEIVYNASTPPSISDVANKAHQVFPELSINNISFWDEENHVVYVSGYDGTVLTRGRAYAAFDTRTGEFLSKYSPATAGLLNRWIDTADELHFGVFAGLWSQILYVIFGLALCALILTGAYLQAQRQTRRHGRIALRIPIATAYLFTLFAMVMALYGGMMEIKAYGTNGQWPQVSLPVTTFIAVWVASTIAAMTIWMWRLR